MKPQDIRAMADVELDTAIANAERELFNLRFQHTSGRLSDTSRMRQVRRDLARLRTVGRERALWTDYQLETETEA